MLGHVPDLVDGHGEPGTPPAGPSARWKTSQRERQITAVRFLIYLALNPAQDVTTPRPNTDISIGHRGRSEILKQTL